MAIFEVKNRLISRTWDIEERYVSWTLDTDAGTLFFKRPEDHKHTRTYDVFRDDYDLDRHYFIRDFVTRRDGLLVTKAEHIRDGRGPCIVLGGYRFTNFGGYARRVEEESTATETVYKADKTPNQPIYCEFVFPHGGASKRSAKEFVNAIQPFVDTRFWGSDNLYDGHNQYESLKIWAYFFHEIDEDAREYLRYLQQSNHPEDAWAKGIRSSQISHQALNDDIVEKLQELAELKEKGLIDEEEFKSAKNKLLE